MNALMHTAKASLLTLLLLGTAGCSKGPTVSPVPAPSTASAETLPVMPKVEATPVELKPITRAGLAEEIGRHKGKVVLVNFWAFL